MTFKGTTYECIMDFLRLKVVAQANLKAYNVEKEMASKIRDTIKNREVMQKIIVQEKFIEELNKIEKAFIKELKKIAENTSDIEFAVFVYTFVYGMQPLETQRELGISNATYYTHIYNIKERIEGTPFEKYLKNEEE